MIALAHRFLTAGVLVIWSAALCFFYFSGRITAYLHPTFQPYALACGITLGIFAILVLLSPEEAVIGASGCEPGKPRSTFGSLVLALILVVPLVVTMAFSRDEFSAVTVLNRGYVDSVTQVPANLTFAQPALPGEEVGPGDDEVPEMPPPEIIDLLYAAQLPELRAEIEDKPIELIGQFMPAEESNPDGNRFRLVRMMLMCCASDAQPISVIVEADAAKDFKEMTWVKVAGRTKFPVIDGQLRPLLKADSVVQTDPPKDPFLY